MTERQYTEDERKAAWERADPLPGEHPDRFRMDTVNNAAIPIEWDKFEKREKFGWTIDAEGRARRHDYKMPGIAHRMRASIDRP